MRSNNKNTSNSPEDKCPPFQVARIHARMINFYQKYFVESIPYDKVNPNEIRQNRCGYKNIDGIENKLTRFPFYPETELDCKHTTSFYKRQYSEIFVEYEKGFDMKAGKIFINTNPTHHSSNNNKNSYTSVTFLKNTENTGGKRRPQDNGSTRLQELTLMKSTFFGTIH